MLTPFTQEDADRAYDEWGVNCGPSALAAIMGMTLNEVRPHMRNFERKHYTNPNLMNAALRSIRRPWRNIGANARATALRAFNGKARGRALASRCAPAIAIPTGSASIKPTTGIFDINCMNNGTGWCSLDDWVLVIVPHLTAQYPRATGSWHITHRIEIEKLPAKITRTVLSFPGDPDVELLPVEADHKM